MTTADDHQLLHAWRDGDARASEALLRRYYDRVYRFFDVRVPAAAEDLTQRTFLACLESIDRLRSATSFRAFVFGIARNHLLRHYDERVRSDRASEFAELLSGHGGLTASRLIAIHQEQRLVLRALAELPTPAQLAVHLFYFDGLRNAEIAEVLGESVSAVTSRLSRARGMLRGNIESLHAGESAKLAVLADLEAWVRSMAELQLDPAVRYRPRSSGEHLR